MDLSFTAEERAFRTEVRDFFSAHLPPALRQKVKLGQPPARAELVAWCNVLADRGWAVPHWPNAWGGAGWTPIQRHIFLEESFLANAPQPPAFGPSMVGPVLYTFGSAEQQQRFLPRIPRLQDWWCQGFSEPNSGSDLASLRCAAVQDGSDWVVNGQKTWTTYAHYATWIFCLVRTDKDAKKQEGIGFLLIDMASPGVTVRPIVTLDGGTEVNEVWFDNVRVPGANMVGDPRKGWDYAKFLLSNERIGIARLGFTKERLRRIRALAASETEHGAPLLEDRGFRERLAALEVELKALELTQLRVLANDAKRGPQGKPDPASSILKLKGSELQQAATELLMELAAPYGMPDMTRLAGSNDLPDIPDWAGTATPHYLNWRKVSIYGGSSEIQKNIVAKAVLGL